MTRLSINFLGSVQFVWKIISMAKITLFAVLLLIGSPINASEKSRLFRLVYVFSDQCVFCKAWERDVGRLYGDTEYAKRAPLFKIDITAFAASEPLLFFFEVLFLLLLIA